MMLKSDMSSSAGARPMRERRRQRMVCDGGGARGCGRKEGAGQRGTGDNEWQAPLYLTQYFGDRLSSPAGRCNDDVRSMIYVRAR